MQDIVKRQRDFFYTHQSKNLKFRIEQLKKLKDILKKSEKDFAKAIYADFKKSDFENYMTEFALLYHDIDQACNKLKKWSSRKKVAGSLVNFPSKNYIIPEPLGVCLVIGAWNYPYQLSFAPVIAALAAGNTVILKPSEVVSNTAGMMASVINQNFDSQIFHVIEGGVEETTKLLEQKFDKIFFTGSTAVGKIVYQAAAKNLTPVTLELGGKSPAFVTQDCDLKITAKRLVWGKFLNAGQTCVAPDYIYADKRIQKELLKALKEEIIGAAYSIKNKNFVQIVNDKNFDRLLKLIEPDKVFWGGKVDKEQRVISPTILQGISFDDKIMQEEIFGPLLPVIAYSNLDDALEVVSKREKPLACYIFTNDKAIKNKILKQISFGGGGINETFSYMLNSNLPFGGVGASGTGSYHGEFGFKTFSHYKSIIEKPLWFEASVKYSPYSGFKKYLIRTFIG